MKGLLGLGMSETQTLEKQQKDYRRRRKRSEKKINTRGMRPRGSYSWSDDTGMPGGRTGHENPKGKRAVERKPIASEKRALSAGL